MRAATAYMSWAFTFGVMSDHDARLARMVAASLSLDAHLFEVPQLTSLTAPASLRGGSTHKTVSAASTIGS